MAILVILGTLLATAPPTLGATYFADNFDPAPQPGWSASDNGMGTAWTAGTPAAGPPGCHTAPTCYGANLDTNYTNNAVATLITPSIDLSGASAATLHFWRWFHTEVGWDYFFIAVSTNGGGSWTDLGAFSGAGTSWQPLEYDLTPYVGGSILLRFRLMTDSSNVYPGVYIDDVVVDDVPPTPDFVVGCVPSEVTFAPNTTSSVICSLLSMNGFSAPIVLDCQGAPVAVNCTFQPNPATPPPNGLFPDVLTLDVDLSVPPGTYDFDVVGTSGPLVRTYGLRLTVAVGPDFILGCAPSSLAAEPAGNDTSVCTVTSRNGFSNPVNLACYGQPAGVTCNLNPTPVTPPPNGSVTSNLTVSVGAAVAEGTYWFQVIGFGGPVYRGTVIELVVASSDAVATQPSPLAPDSVIQGATDVPFLQLNVSVNNNTASLTSVALNLTGTGADADVAQVRLWQDDGDGNFTPTTDSPLSSGTFTAGAVTLPAGLTIAAAAPEVLFVSYDIASTATPGAFLGGGVSNASFTIAPPDVAVCAACPVDTYVPSTRTEVLPIPADLLTFTPQDLAPPTVMPGQTEVVMGALLLTVDNNTALLESMRLDLSGLPPSEADVALVKVWWDDGDGLFSSTSDSQIAAGPFFAGSTNLPLSPQPLVDVLNPERLWITFSINGTAGVGNRIGIAIASAGYAAASPPDAVACSGCPFTTFDGLKTEIVANSPPEAQSLTVDGFAPGSPGILHILTANPLLVWSYTDPNSDLQSDYEVRIGSAPGLNDVWSPGPTGTPGLSVFYGGPPLLDATTYYFAVRVSDSPSWSPWNETQFHTNGIPPIPTTPVVPADGATVAAGSGATVSWSSGGPDPEADVITYDWWVSTDPGFAVLLASGSTPGLASTAFITVPSTQYFWRVRAHDGYEASANASFSFNTSAVVDNAPSAGTLTVDGFLPGSLGIGHILSANPAFAWTYDDPEGAPQTDHEVRVGSAPGLSDLWAPGPAGTPGLAAPHAGLPLAPGTDYWLGVRVHDGNGWSPWNETLFHMNDLAPPPTTPVTPSDAGRVVAGSTTVSWTSGGLDPEGDVVSYDWDVATDSGFTAIVASGSGSTTSTSFTAAAGTTYFWRVQACDFLQCPGTWSAWSFAANMPPVVAITDPSSGEVFTGGVARSASLSVTDADDTTWTATLEFSADGGGNWVSLGSAVPVPPSGISWTPPCPSTIQGLVRATISDGLESGQDTTPPFTVDCDSPAATVFVPGPTGVPVTATVQVNFNEAIDVAGPGSFALLGPSGPVLGALTWSGNTLLTFDAAADLAACTIYLVRVSGFLDGSDPGLAVTLTTSSFTTDCPPEAGGLTVDRFAPGTAGIGHILTAAPTFAWTYADPDTDAQVDYQVRVGTAQGLDDLWAPLPAGMAAVATPYAGPALADGTGYYFGVRVHDGEHWSPWNETLFHTNEAPPAPAPLTPGNSVVLAAGTATLTWSSVVDAEGDPLDYSWEVATDSGFTAVVASGSTNGTASTGFATMAGAAYFWRVRANDTWEDGPLSATFTFTAVGSVTVQVNATAGPLAGAVVRLVGAGTDLNLTTGAGGQVTFPNLGSGTYAVTVTAARYTDRTTTATVSAADPDPILYVAMTPAAGEQPTAEFPWLWVVVLVVLLVAIVLFLLGRRREPREAAPADDVRKEQPPRDEEEPPAMGESEPAADDDGPGEDGAA